MRETLTMLPPDRYAFGAMASAEGDVMDDPGQSLPSGWWLLPCILTGAGMWIGLAVLIL